MGLILALISIIIMVILISIPMYIASKIVVHNRNSTFGNAILSTILTVFILAFISLFILFIFAPLAILGNILAFLITFIILLYTYNGIYGISTLRSFALAVMELIIWYIFFIITGDLFVFKTVL